MEEPPKELKVTQPMMQEIQIHTVKIYIKLGVRDSLEICLMLHEEI